MLEAYLALRCLPLCHDRVLKGVLLCVDSHFVKGQERATLICPRQGQRERVPPLLSANLMSKHFIRVPVPRLLIYMNHWIKTGPAPSDACNFETQVFQTLLDWLPISSTSLYARKKLDKIIGSDNELTQDDQICAVGLASPSAAAWTPESHGAMRRQVQTELPASACTRRAAQQPAPLASSD